MPTTILGIGQLAATSNPEDSLKILGLGSCVALIMIDPQTSCVGMSHVALPHADLAFDGDETLPGKFADTAVDALITTMQQAGARRDAAKYLVKLVGGANLSGLSKVFNIGKRNVLALRRELWIHNMGASREEVGGRKSRCVKVQPKPPQVLIYSPGTDGHVL